MSGHHKRILFFLLTFGVFTFISLNWHSHRPKFNFQSEIWGDRAGYHVFLPAALEYRFDPDRFQEGVDRRTGNGFLLDSIPGKVVTKYTCGEALLRAPFYLVGMLFRNKDDPGGAGFTTADHAMVDVAAAFYCTLGLWLLYGVLCQRYQARAAGWSLLAILMGTNLLFYTVGDSGMTHVYSFFLFALWTHRIDRTVPVGPTNSSALTLGAIAGLIFLLRPTNIVFLPMPFIFLGIPKETIRGFLLRLIQPLRLALLLGGGLLVWLPQLAYWDYAFGSPIVWSYGSEGFSNLLTPQLVPFWFAPYNGLFTYAPLLLVILVASLFLAKAPGMRVATWGTFIVVSYICSAWFAWTFGCSFGSRNFVEYSALFVVPLAAMLRSDHKYRMIVRGLVLMSCLCTTKLTLSSSNCWFGSTWDWTMYWDLLAGPLKI